MSDENRNEEDKDKRGDFRLPSRTVVIWVIILGFITVLMLFRNTEQNKAVEITYSELAKKIDDQLIVSGTISYNQQSPFLRKITGTFYKTDAKGNILTDKATGKPAEIAFKTETPLTDTLTEKLLASGKFKAVEPNMMLVSIIYSLLPLLLIVALIYFFLVRQIKMAGKGALSFGKSKPRMLSTDKNKLIFKAVPGSE